MTAGKFGVRFATAADLAEVVALERGVAEAPHWAEGEYAAIVAETEGAEGAVRRCFFVAETPGQLLGFAVGKVIGSGRGGIGELESVVVAAEARRGGVGRALCTAVVAWGKGLGATALELEVRVGSAGAIALYTGLGFVASGRRGWYYREPAEDALMMRLDLGKEK
jgi:[ribosomal protein S18]-alanine N-acetyltransferase